MTTLVVKTPTGLKTPPVGCAAPVTVPLREDPLLPPVGNGTLEVFGGKTWVYGSVWTEVMTVVTGRC